MTKPAVSPKTTIIFDTNLRDQTSLALVRGTKSEIVTAPVRAQDLQRLVGELLASNKLTLADIDTFGVLTGPGSFTGTRIGIVATNVFGWLTNKPIVELPGDDLGAAITHLLKQRPETVKQARARY